MTIDYRRYGKGPRHARNHRIAVNIRLRRHKSLGGRPTAAELREVLQYMLDTDGRIPRGWQFAAIEWRNPSMASQEWRSGRIADFSVFREAIEYELNNLRMAIVRPDGSLAHLEE